MPIFPDIDALEAYVDANIIANGAELITGPINNDALNGCIQFIRESPLNWEKASIESGGGAVIAQTPVVVFMTTTPTTLTWNDNIYNEYVFINMTAAVIPLLGALVYYDINGNPQSSIPASSAVNLFKAQNDLWVQGNTASGGGGGSTQKEPKTYVVGSTVGAPTAGTFTWQLGAFANSYVILFVNGGKANQSDAGNGSPFTTKVLASDTLTIGNYTGGWQAGDVLDIILITP